VDLRRSQLDVNTLALALMGNVQGYSVTRDAAGATAILNQNGTAVALLGGSQAGQQPTASISYYLYDEQMNFVASDYRRLSGRAGVTDLSSLQGAHEELVLEVPDKLLGKAGYLLIELSHDVVEDVDVYFDDLTVTYRSCWCRMFR